MRLAAAAERVTTAARLAGQRVTVDVLALDITHDGAVDAIGKALAQRQAFCDLLVNAAAIGIAGDFLNHDPAALDRLVALNVQALTRLTRHFLSPMLARGHGGILNVASLGGYAPGPYQAAYYASKAYVISLTEALAQECAGRGVRISVLAPGPVRTRFHARMGGESALYLKLLPVPTAERVARTAWVRFRLGQRVIIPGLLNPFMMCAMRIIPHRLIVPVIGFLLKPRGPGQRPQH